MKRPTHAYMGPEKHTYQLNRIMNKTPLALFSGLVVAAAATSGYFAYQNAVAPAAVPVAVASKAPEPVPTEPPASAVPKTADLSPTFDTARVSPEGDAVIAGRAAPGADVALLLNGAVIGTGKADEAGEFVIVPAKPLPTGDGALALEANQNGKTARSAETVAVSIKSKPAPEAKPAAQTAVAVVTLVKPTMEPPKPASDSVTLDSIDYDAAGNIQFAGRARAGNAVRLYVDNSLAGETKTDGKGTWSYKDDHGSVATGTHELRADEVDASGAVLSRAASPFKREEPAKLAEAASPTAPTDPNAPPVPNKITIQPGNTLWRLSRDLYGAGRNYTIIFDANRSQIRNPRLIYPGQILTAPSKSGN
jgi:nucleoid-associated protein YgaU